MKVEFSAEARSQVERIDAWWRENRWAAPELLADELEEAVRVLGSMPGVGVPYAPKPGVRRVLLTRTRYHLYIVQEASRVVVVTVWSAYRGRGPRL